jgi:putative oxidoreductase
MNAGLLILRVVLGVALIGHGTQKLFGWFGGHGRRRTGAFFELLGYRPGALFAIIAGLSETGAGVLLAMGFLTPLAGAAVVGVMLNAAAAIATLLMRRPAAAQSAPASGPDKPLGKAA